ncbi:MAG: CDP-alcohol phosphatidyltransferase family protein [Aeromicrobium sp.]|nr:MAG: CDP-alcohol phosphatidyltransferase family protein [Aeromicrobium sp.]
MPDQPRKERERARHAPTPRHGKRSTVLTVPNMLSFARIGMVPLFLWLVLGPQHDELAIVVLIVSGITDYLDGKIARSTGQVTALGALLDPIADRLFILAAVIGLTLRDVIPWWLAVLLVSRDVIVVALVPILRTRGFSSLPVHFLGKAATAVLLYAFPLLLLGDGYTAVANLARVFGWAFTVWGVALYWWAGILYFLQLRHVVKTMPKVGRS